MLDFDMSPYGFFVWGSYGLSALGISGLIIHSNYSAHKAKAALIQSERLWVEHQARFQGKDHKNDA